ncbi:FHA domain-containing protein [Cohnella pontilimi]|uniref:FHA domain-containing protein n=2 Tax=Cohnella pontilimi TaxID=2564100 RepID=A0A4U0F867_9BACL|nr:FHA domain-containing protein [Cohnella pontilimi]
MLAGAVAEPRDEPSSYTIPLDIVGLKPASPEPEIAGEPRVCGVDGVFAGSCFRLTGGGVSIGRDPAACSVVFPVEIGEVSRRHCTLTFEESRRLFLLEDHGSSNGTYLPGGRRLEPGKRYELRSGERFSLSGSVHWFEVRE